MAALVAVTNFWSPNLRRYSTGGGFVQPFPDAFFGGRWWVETTNIVRQTRTRTQEFKYLMATTRVVPSWKAVVMVTLVSLLSCSGNSDQKVYVVYMGDRPKGDFSTTTQHMSLLHTTLGRLTNLLFITRKKNL